MRLLISCFLPFALLVAGCSSSPDYKAAEGNGYGYQESKLSDSQYRVHFKARGSDKSKAMDFAMLRAAELTLEQGFDWFTVSSRETLVDNKTVDRGSQVGFSKRYETRRECGLLTCRTRTEPTSSYSAGVFLGGDKSSDIEAVLNITMGNGNKPSSAFDATQVKNNLQPNSQD